MQEKSVLWVTNMAPPYRIPVWAEMAKHSRLTVGLLENSQRLGRDTRSNRGADWVNQTVPGAEIHEYRCVRIRRGQDLHYGLYDPRASLDLAKSDVLLLAGWDSPAEWQLLAQAKVMRKPSVGFYESTLASQAFSSGPIAEARNLFFHSLDRVVVPGPAAREAVAAMGVPDERIIVGFNAVDSARFAQIPPVQQRSGHRFCFVGRLIELKNIDGIMRAFAAIAEDGDRLDIVGKGELKDSLVALAGKLGVADRVDFTDHMPNAELPLHFLTQDTLVLASHLEVWGLVVNEALASGMQTVVTENCGVAPSVSGMPGVYLAASTDVMDIADAMRRAKHGFTGRITNPPILEETPERFAHKFLEACEQALTARRKGKR